MTCELDVNVLTFLLTYWHLRGDEGSEQRRRYDLAVEQWNLGASEDDVAAMIGRAA